MTSPITIVIIVTFSILVTINLAGNVLVLMIVLGNRVMKTPMNCLLVNLSTADIMVAVSVTIQYIFGPAYVHPSGSIGNHLCRSLTGGNFTWIGTAASVFCLVVIAAERHDAIVAGRRRSRLEGIGVYVVLCFCWLFAFLLNLPLLMYLRFNPEQKGENKCDEDWPTVEQAKAYTVVCFVASGVLPLAIMVVLYSRIVYTLWVRPLIATGRSQQTILESKKKVTKMLIVVSSMYAICRFPNLFMYLFAYFLPEAYVYGSTLYIISIALVVLNSSMNPFLYSLHSERFRKHLKSILSWRLYSFVDQAESSSWLQPPVFYVTQDMSPPE